MEVLEHGECFEETTREYKYAYTLIVYRVRVDVYYAITKSRCRFTNEVKLEELSNVVLILTITYCPLFPPNFTRALDPLPPNCYIKHPYLLSYNPIYNTLNGSRISERVLKEAEVYKILKLNPHLNIAKYLGYQVYNRRITRIYFTKYSDTLMHRVNLKNRGKRAFIFNDRLLKKPDLNRVKKGI